MEANLEHEASPEQWEWIDETIILVGLLLCQASLFKSGYSAEVMTELQDRLNKLIKRYGGDTNAKGY